MKVKVKVLLRITRVKFLSTVVGIFNEISKFQCIEESLEKRKFFTLLLFLMTPFNE